MEGHSQCVKRIVLSSVFHASMRRDIAPGGHVNETTCRGDNAFIQFPGFGVFLLSKTYLFYLVLVSSFILYLDTSVFSSV